LACWPQHRACFTISYIIIFFKISSWTVIYWILFPVNFVQRLSLWKQVLHLKLHSYSANINKFSFIRISYTSCSFVMSNFWFLCFFLFFVFWIFLYILVFFYLFCFFRIYLFFWDFFFYFFCFCFLFFLEFVCLFWIFFCFEFFYFYSLFLGFICFFGIFIFILRIDSFFFWFFCFFSMIRA